MNQSQPDPSATLDLVLPEPLARRREECQRAWEAALQGGPIPQLDSFLHGVDETARVLLQHALVIVQSEYQKRIANLASIPLEGAVRQAGEQTVDLPRPAGAGTVEFAPAAQDTEVDSRSPRPAAAEAPIGATMDFVPPGIEASGRTADFDSRRDTNFELSIPDKPVAEEKAAEFPEVAGYQILGVLGRGAMGVVYKARQRGLRRTVALKMILAGSHASEHDLARFGAEARAVGDLQHANIVQVYEVGEADGKPFFSLEYVDGGSLQKKLAGAPQPILASASMVQVLAQAMDVAHRKLIIHRDLKPANIMLMQPKGGDSGASATLTLAPCEQVYGTPKIADFGLAKRFDEDSGQTRSGTILGTPSYMAPEQAAGRTKHVGPPSDIYALGAILYEMLTGRPPFRGETLLDTLEQVRNEEPVPPSRLQPKIPQDLETICLKCLQKEPSKRYITAGDLAEDLRRYQAGEPIQARAVSTRERLWRWCRRNPRLAALTAAVAVLLVAVASISTWFAFTLADEKAETERQREEAVAAKTEAETKHKAAIEQHSLALDPLLTLVAKVQQRVGSATAAKKLDPQVRELQEELINTAIEGMKRAAKSVEASGVTPYGMAVAHGRMGSILRQIGRSDEALEQYKLSNEIATRVAAAEPLSNKAQGNFAVTLKDLADMLLESRSDLKTAKEHYVKGYQIWVKLAARPQKGEPSPKAVRQRLAEASDKLGWVASQEGDPRSAREYYSKALELRLQWANEEPKNIELQRALATSFGRLGEVSFHQRDPKAALEYYQKALEGREAIVKTEPKNAGYHGELATMLGMYGDVHLRLKNTASARVLYERAHTVYQTLLERNPKNVFLQRALGLAHYRLGAAFARDGDKQRADGHFRESLRMAEESAAADPANLSQQRTLMIRRARCGLHIEAAKMADELRASKDASEVGLQIACCYSLCAAAVADGKASADLTPEQRKQWQRYADLAVDALRQTKRQVVKDPIYLETDPDLDALRDYPGFQAVLNELRQAERPSAKS